MKACLVVVMAGCGWAGVQGSGKAASEVRPIASFSAIELSGSFDAEIAIAPDQRVEIAGDDNLLPLVTTEIHGDRLKIGTRENVRPKVPLVAHITAPRITAIEVSGSSSVAIHGVHDDHLTLSVSGSAVIHGDGAVREVSIDVSGSGKIDLEKLTAERASATISGSGEVAIEVSRALDAHISGSGTITYHGDPTELSKDVSGSGRVIKR